MANPYNNCIGNVATGLTDSGWVGTDGGLGFSWLLCDEESCVLEG